MHGHLDVVPADPPSGRSHPFSGEVADGYVWGRGAVDMKDFDAMLLATVRQMRREGRTPPRDLVLAFLADEEAGGQYGGHWLVDNHPELFEGCTEAIGEVGGFTYTVSDDLRLYLIETAEKGLTWLRLHARGRPGHGSMVHDDNAVTAVAEAVARVGRHRFPVVDDRHRAGLPGPSCRTRSASSFDPDEPELAIAKLGAIAPIIGSTIRNTANPTRLAAGYKENVIPSRASATIDCRTLPGQHDSFLDQLREVIGPDSRSRSSSGSRRWRPRSTGRWSRRWRPPCAGRIRPPGPCRTCSPAAPTPRRSPGWASGASASPRCACHRT